MLTDCIYLPVVLLKQSWTEKELWQEGDLECNFIKVSSNMHFHAIFKRIAQAIQCFQMWGLKIVTSHQMCYVYKGAMWEVRGLKTEALVSYTYNKPIGKKRRNQCENINMATPRTKQMLSYILHWLQDWLRVTVFQMLLGEVTSQKY